MDTPATIQAKSGPGAGRAGGRARAKATYQDVLDAPPHKVAEVVDGRLYTHPRPAMPHAVAGSSLGDELVSPFQKGRGGPGGWWIIDEPEIHFGVFPDEEIIVPDLAGWRRSRMPERPVTAFVTLAPDWVCEILSPSTRHFDLGDKRDLYAREGVPYLWLVDPDARTLEAFALQERGWKPIAALADAATVSLPPFEAVSFPLGGLWP